MASLWPGGLDVYTVKVDGVDDVLAAHVNNLQDSVVAVETELGTGGLKGSTASLTARLNVGLNADGTLKSSGFPSPIPANSVDTNAIQNLAVTAAKIANTTITATQIANATITGTQIAALTIATGNIANSAIDSTKLATDAVTTAKIVDANVTAVKLAVALRTDQALFMDVQAAGAATVVALVQPDLVLHTSSITNPDVPRIASFSLKNVSGGTLTSATVNATIIGVDSTGQALTEVIQIPTQSINDATTVTVFGVKAFATITSWQLDQAQSVPASWQVSFGTGDKVGLPRTIATVYKLKKNTADVAVIPAVSAANNTIDLAAISAGDDFTVWYRSA